MAKQTAANNKILSNAKNLFLTSIYKELSQMVNSMGEGFALNWITSGVAQQMAACEVLRTEYKTVAGLTAAWEACMLPTEAPQAAPVASADSGQAVDEPVGKLGKCECGEPVHPNTSVCRRCGRAVWGVTDEQVERDANKVRRSNAAQPTSAQAGGDAVSDAAQIKTLDALVKAQHELMDKLEYNSLEYRAEGYTLTQLQLRLERIRNSGTIARLEAELATARAALEAIARNAPEDEPDRYMTHSRAAAIAWAFWVAGQKALEALGK